MSSITLIFRGERANVRNPTCLILRANGHEADLHRINAPFVFEERKERLGLFFRLASVDIDADFYAVGLGVSGNLLDIQTRFANLCCVAGVVVAIPVRIESNVVQAELRRKINDRLGAIGGQGRVAHRLAGLDPGSVLNGAGRIQVEQKVIPLEKIAGLFTQNEGAPR